MDLVAPLIRRVLFPGWVAKNRSKRLSYLRALERSQFLSRDEIRDLQWRQFKAILRHAYAECSFYRRKYLAAGLHPDDIESLDDLSSVPHVTKPEIQEWAPQMIAERYRSAPLCKDMTGGSTGSPTVFYYDEDRLDSRVAATLRHNRWTGWNIGDKTALLWGAPRDVASAASVKGRIRDWILDRRVILDASTIDDDRMLAFCRVLARHQPRYVLAYANTMALFARFVRREGLAPFSPAAIICSGELLTAESRALIESTFNCRVFNRYGSREFAVIASECGHHEGLHVNADNLLVEPQGEIVITDLRNFAMPMIRYRTGDVGEAIERSCACGRGLPLMEMKGGRTTDFLIGASGQKVSGIVLATYGITDIAGVRQVQFVQRQRGAIVARVVRGPAWSDTAGAQLVSRIHTWLGDGMRVQLDFADSIPQEASGKFRFSISTIPAE